MCSGGKKIDYTKVEPLDDDEDEDVRLQSPVSVGGREVETTDSFSSAG